jgi:hypothetical protein
MGFCFLGPCFLLTISSSVCKTERRTEKETQQEIKGGREGKRKK